MAYRFTFDLTDIPEALFNEIELLINTKRTKKQIKLHSKKFVEKYNIDTITGLSNSDARILIEDVIEIQMNNNILKKHFHKGNDKALFLPHCCRKHMDSNCKAVFQPETSSYSCVHCSQDCMVSKATEYAKDKGYDVYVLPGGSCVNKIFDKHQYDAVVGVACTDEIKLAAKSFLKLRIPCQAIPLLKNGCSFTAFSIDMLVSILATG